MVINVGVGVGPCNVAPGPADDNNGWEALGLRPSNLNKVNLAAAPMAANYIEWHLFPHKT